MSSAVLEEVVEEASKALQPDEQQQLRAVLSGEDFRQGFGFYLLAFGVLYLLEKRNALPSEDRQRLSDLVNRAAADSGLVDRAAIVRSIRGKYAHLGMSSEEFAAQKQKEIELEDRRR